MLNLLTYLYYCYIWFNICGQRIYQKAFLNYVNIYFFTGFFFNSFCLVEKCGVTPYFLFRDSLTFICLNFMDIQLLVETTNTDTSSNCNFGEEISKLHNDLVGNFHDLGMKLSMLIVSLLSKNLSTKTLNWRKLLQTYNTKL